MRKRRSANLHYLCCKVLSENTRLTPQIEIDNIHQRHTTDAYEHAPIITAWQQIYGQLCPGQFHGEFTEILLGEIQVPHGYTGLALRQSCMVWSNIFWFGILVAQREQGFIGPQHLGRVEIATRPDDTEFKLSTPDNYTTLGVVISEEMISCHAGFLHHLERVLHVLRNQSALTVWEPHRVALRGFMQRALAAFSEHPDTLHQSVVRKVLRDSLLLTMEIMLEETQPVVNAKSISHQSYRRLLTQAREYVLEGSAGPLTVLDLCRQLYVSRRTLQSALHMILGTGPNAWLKRIRLNAVRREPISPRLGREAVKGATIQRGF